MNAFVEKTFDDIANQIASTLQISEGMNEDQKAVAFGQWMKSWVSMKPQNGNSNRAYNGCNALLTGLMMHHKGWEHPFFMTFNGVKKLGGRVNKGEKSLPIFWWEMIPLKDKTTGEVTGCFPKLKVFKVFNIAQTTVDPDKCKKVKCEGKRIEEIDNMVANLGVEFFTADPCYVPSTDKIGMPDIKSFKTEGDYYAALTHELGHYTMHEERCNRSGDKKLSYAQEELVAELTSAFLCAEFGIEGNLQHPEYIGSWIKGLKDQPRAFFDAARMAQKSANWILKNGMVTKETEETEAA
jgi:antirestriction protein ArdC